MAGDPCPLPTIEKTIVDDGIKVRNGIEIPVIPHGRALRKRERCMKSGRYSPAADRRREDGQRMR